MTDTALALPDAVTVTTTGLHIPEGISREDWEEVGSKLGEVDKRMQWMVGDWINAGEREGYISPDTYDAAERLFPQLGRTTLKQYAYVANASSIRIDDLTFAHHQAVASLDEDRQAGWLNEAAAEDWSVSELRKQIKAPPAGTEEAESAGGVAGKRESKRELARLENLIDSLTNFHVLLREVNLDAAMQQIEKEKAADRASKVREVKADLSKLVTALESAGGGPHDQRDVPPRPRRL